MPVFQCAICEQQVVFVRSAEVPWRPFCSERCKMVDLGRWLDGTYSISEPLPAVETRLPQGDGEQDAG